MSLHRMRPPTRQLARLRVLREERPTPPKLETLYASDEAAAIERILDDVYGSTESEIADRILPSLQQTLHAAFLTGDDGAWREVYRRIVVVVDGCGSRTSPAIQRLRAFVAENEDLAEYASGVSTRAEPANESAPRF